MAPRKRTRRQDESGEESGDGSAGDREWPGVPPKVKSAWGTEHRQLAEDSRKRKAWVHENRPALSLTQYKALLPCPMYGPYWSHMDEEQLQLDWQADPVRQRLDGANFGSRELRTLWKMVPRFFGCLPTDLISVDHSLEYDLGDPNLKHKIVAGQRVPNPLWSATFCDNLRLVMTHPFWRWSKERLGLMANIIQYAVICRTHDVRRWPLLHNPTTDRFLDALIQSSRIAAPTTPVVTVHDMACSALRGKEQSPYSILLRAIEEQYSGEPVRPPVSNDGVPFQSYKVRAVDLAVVCNALQSACSTPGGTWSGSASLWASLAGESRASSRAEYPNSDAEVKGYIMQTALARKMDERIAVKRSQTSQLIVPVWHGAYEQDESMSDDESPTTKGSLSSAQEVLTEAFGKAEPEEDTGRMSEPFGGESGLSHHSGTRHAEDGNGAYWTDMYDPVDSDDEYAAFHPSQPMSVHESVVPESAALDNEAQPAEAAGLARAPDGMAVNDGEPNLQVRGDDFVPVDAGPGDDGLVAPIPQTPAVHDGKFANLPVQSGSATTGPPPAEPPRPIDKGKGKAKAISLSSGMSDDGRGEAKPVSIASDSSDSQPVKDESWLARHWSEVKSTGGVLPGDWMADRVYHPQGQPFQTVSYPRVQDNLDPAGAWSSGVDDQPS